MDSDGKAGWYGDFQPGDKAANLYNYSDCSNGPDMGG